MSSFSIETLFTRYRIRKVMDLQGHDIKFRIGFALKFILILHNLTTGDHRKSGESKYDCKTRCCDNVNPVLCKQSLNLQKSITILILKLGFHLVVAVYCSKVIFDKHITHLDIFTTLATKWKL